jgi:acetyl-CoA carboxylase biotin carboxyl carrier protein
MTDHDREQNFDPAVLDATAATVKMLAEVMAANGLTHIEIEAGGFQIKLKSETHQVVAMAAAPVPAAPVAIAAAPAPAPAAPEPPAGYFVTSPMIGTFYTSPSPGEPVFVKPGDRVEVGQTIGIIEAMKIMNEIAADRAGVVDEVLVANGQAVEFGSPLLRLAQG